MHKLTGDEDRCHQIMIFNTLLMNFFQRVSSVENSDSSFYQEIHHQFFDVNELSLKTHFFNYKIPE